MIYNEIPVSPPEQHQPNRDEPCMEPSFAGKSRNVNHFWFGVIGVVVILVGVSLTVFNRPYSAFRVAFWRRLTKHEELFQRRSNGRIPIVTPRP